MHAAWRHAAGMRRRAFKTMFTLLLLTYLLCLLTVLLLQRQMLYFPTRYDPEQQDTLLQQRQLQLWPATGAARGLIAAAPLPAAKGTVLVFHGNAGAAIDRSYYRDALQRLGYRTILAEYPGYGARPGAPSEDVLIADGLAAAQAALQQFGPPLFICGESLGSGVAAGIIASGLVPVKGLLLITPFDSLRRVAQHHYWFLLARWLLRDGFDNAARLRSYRGNVAVILAGSDAVIPNANTLALFDALPGRKQLWRFEQAGHNTLPIAPEQAWWQEAMQFLDD